MFTHYFELALRSLRRSPALTALMIVALGLGIGASMTTITVHHVLSADPVPHKSDRLFYVQMEARTAGSSPADLEPLEQLTRYDAETLLREKRGVRQVMMTGGRAALRPTRDDVKPFFAPSRYTSADFFTMFETPWLFGGPWDAAADSASARVAVISQEVNQKLFAGENSVGRMVRVGANELRIVGVMKAWRPVPHYYDLIQGRFADSEGVFVPFSTAMDLRLSISGSMSCWGNSNPSDRRAPLAPCAWTQYWVELPSAADAAAYREYLVNYAEQQRAAGRFQRATSVRLRDVNAWLDYKRVVPGDVRLQVWLALGFLAVCLTNTVGLLLAKFLRRSPEIGVRRALGATRGAIFAQLLVEAGVVGIAGGVLGVGLAMLGLWGVRQNPAPYAQLAQLDWQMLLATLAFAVAASLIAGLLPAWRACQVTPALQLKSQ